MHNRDFSDTHPTEPAPRVTHRGPPRSRPKRSPLLIALGLVWVIGLAVILFTL